LRSGSDLILVCSGTHEETAYEDALAAGALCDILAGSSLITSPETLPYGRGSVRNTAFDLFSDSALMAWKLYQAERHDLAGAIGKSRNGKRLLSLPDLRSDVPICLRRDVSDVVAALASDGVVRRVQSC